MDDEIARWEVISKEPPKAGWWETLFGFLLGCGPLVDHPFKFTVRQRSTGYVKTILAFDERELPERIAKGAFHFERIISDDASELILIGLSRGGEARALAFDNIEYTFRRQLEKGDTDPQELFANFQDFLRPAGEDIVQEFTNRCLPDLRSMK